MNASATLEYLPFPLAPTRGSGPDDRALLLVIDRLTSQQSPIMDFVQATRRLAEPSVRRARRKYSIAELTAGASAEEIAELYQETAWAQKGGPLGQELA